MNLRLTKRKILGSIIIPIIVWIIIGVIHLSSTTPGILTSFLEIHNMNNIFSTGNIFIFIIEVIIVYLIWSIFQRRYGYY